MGILLALHRPMTLARVTPLKQYAPVDVHTTPCFTKKKFVALQLDTEPFGSSINASSAPLSITSSRERTSARRLWEFSRMSSISVGGQRIADVASCRPLWTISPLGSLCSATMTMVVLPRALRGSWLGAFLG